MIQGSFKKLRSAVIMAAFSILFFSPTALWASAKDDSLENGNTVYYVDAASAATDPDGSSWENAYADLQSAVDAAAAEGGGDIWVAAGTYTRAEDADQVLIMREAVNLFGGFAGNESTFEERDWDAYPTIIDGEDETRCIVGANNAGLQGFTITGGTADWGGGMYNDKASPTLENCIFVQNHADTYGGAIFNFSSSPEMTNCIFIQNSADDSGGAMFILDQWGLMMSPVSIINCTFVENTAAREGGAIYHLAAASFVARNCIFWDNQSEGDSQNRPILPTHAANVRHSCVQGGFDGNGNIDSDPLFIDAPYNLKLFPESPCIDTGYYYDAPDTDFLGRARPQGEDFDMGAYEYYPRDEIFVYHVDAASTDPDPDGSSWEKAYTHLQSAVDAFDGVGRAQIWVAEGTYTYVQQSVVLVMREGVDMYGGFAGNESSLEERDWLAHPTVIDGERGRICVSGADNARLDGFVIKNGYGYNAGGMINWEKSPIIANCSFENNEGTGSQSAGAIENDGCSSTITNCNFEGNISGDRGGAIRNISSQVTVTNCTFTNNFATWHGGALYSKFGSTRIMNCTVTQNGTWGSWGDDDDDDEGGGFYLDGGWANITNSIFWGNLGGQIVNSSGDIYVQYSCVQGGYEGEGNIDDRPFFVSAPDNLKLFPQSPCIDTGTADNAPDTDVLGRARPRGQGMDMGAYEYYTADEGNARSVRYVNAASDAEYPDGKSWATAYRDLPSAVDGVVMAGLDELWVAEGTYTHVQGAYVLTMEEGVDIYGGFAGHESRLEERDWLAHPTVIDGERRRVCVSGADNARLDGFIIKNGYGYNAGGMTSWGKSPTIANCSFENNEGTGSQSAGAIDNSDCSLTIINCNFEGNRAGEHGGAIRSISSQVTVTNCTFTNNFATWNGGALYSKFSTTRIMNCTFAQNSPYSYWGDDDEGGGFYLDSGRAYITNSIFWGNLGGQIVNSSGTVNVQYSCVQGGYEGEGNIGLPPLFVGAPDNVKLFPQSPCIDAGTATNAPDTDILGRQRPQGTGIDMGAYEHHTEDADTPKPIYYANAASEAEEPDGKGWATAYKDLQSALDAVTTAGLDEVWVAAGTYTYVDSDTQSAVLVMQDGVDMYGGFTGNESSHEERDLVAHQSIIDAERKGTCVWGANNARLDGFVIINGKDDYVGGMYNRMKSPVIVNCSFVNNHTQVLEREYTGGAMYNSDCSPTITNCSFVNNSSYNGGAIRNNRADVTVTNCTFAENKAFYVGGAIHSTESNTRLMNCTFVQNKVYDYDNNVYDKGNGGFYLKDGEATITNSIFWANTGVEIANHYGDITVQYSCVQGGYEGTGNIDNPPYFVDAPHNLKLFPHSPCVDTGTTDNGPDTDILGRARPQGGSIDMGAYEYHSGDEGTVYPAYCVNAASVAAEPDGRSWTTAYKDLQSAVDVVLMAGLDEVWVAAGTYTFVDSDTQSAVLVMQDDVNIYGGFTGNESSPRERDWRTYPTIIDAERKGTCVWGANNARLDGFVITNGYDNYVGGMYNRMKSPVIVNCSFVNNRSITTNEYVGGAMYNVDCSPTITNCSFVNNRSSYGGALHNKRADVTVTNCTFTENDSYLVGGAIYSRDSNTWLTNCTFVQNIVSDHLGNVHHEGNGGFYLKDGKATITNSIFWGNTGVEIANHYGDLTVQYSCVQDGHEGTGNIDKDPLFVAAPENLRLSLYSPCVDAGTADHAPETDILGRPRPIGPGIDMGAYEYYHQDEYIDRAHPADVNQNWIITQDEAESYLQKWQEEGAEMTVALRGAYLMKQGGKYRLIPEMEEPLCWEPQN